MKWSEMIVICPELEEMRKRAAAVNGEGEHFCANEIWYQDFKPTLCNLVGWDAKDSRLSGAQRYDLAYQTIYNELPECRDCLCL